MRSQPISKGYITVVVICVEEFRQHNTPLLRLTRPSYAVTTRNIIYANVVPLFYENNWQNICIFQKKYISLH